MRFDITGHPSDATATWAAVADTDWMNREAGNGRVLAMNVVLDDHDYPEIHGALAGPLGSRLPFVEDGNHWVRGKYFVQRRTYDSGPLIRSAYEAHLKPTEAGVIPTLTLELIPRTVLLSPVVRGNLNRVARRWQAVLDRLPGPGQQVTEPLRELSSIADGIYKRWRPDVPGAIADRFRDHLRTARPLDLQQMRAFDLADGWGLDRDAVASAMLAGTQTGLFELYWSVRCPRCKAQTAAATHLGNLADHGDCPSCRIGFGADLSENVEVLFAPHPTLVERVDESFCTLFPMGNPSVEASVILAPGDSFEETVGIEPGRWRLGAGGAQADVGIRVRDDGAHELKWSPKADGERTVVPGAVELKLDNPSEGRVRVQLARVDGGAPIVPATYLTTHPVFRRSMSHQVLAPDIRVSTRSVALVFTDLTGSTAMYAELGDAQAFALVRDHFRVLRTAIEANRGTVVKTIGDAVMASFYEPGQAAAASVQMIREFDTWIETQGLARPPRLKIGMHVGSALVVHTDQAGLDYFGQTVNIAARAQGVADGGELVFTDACATWESLQAVLTEHGLETRSVERDLKGVDGLMVLHKVILGPRE